MGVTADDDVGASFARSLDAGYVPDKTPKEDVEASFAKSLDAPVPVAGTAPAAKVAEGTGAHHTESPDYSNMGFGEAIRRGLGNAPVEAGEIYKALPVAAAHPGETWNAVKSVGRGAGSYLADAYNYATGQQGGPETDQSKQDREAAKSMVAPYTSLYEGVKTGDWAPMKKQLAENLLTTGTSFIPNPGAAGAKAAQVLGKLGTVGKVAGSVVGRTGQLAELATNPVAGVGAVSSLLGSGVKKAAGAATGAGDRSLELAAQAGREGMGSQNLDAFNSHFSGAGTPVEISQRASQAAKTEQSRLSRAWDQERENIFNTNPHPVDHTPVVNAWQEAVHEAQAAARNGDDTGLAAIQHWGPILNSNPQRGMRDMDQLKRILYSQAGGQGLGYTEKRVLDTLHGGVLDALREGDARYGPAMTQYQRNLDDLTNLRSVLGTGDRVAASNEVNRLMKAQKSGGPGGSLLDRLAVHDPQLPFMIAGSALSPAAARGGAGLLEKGSSLLHMGNIGYGMLHGGLSGGIIPAAAAVGQGVIQSPHIAGTVAKAYGRAAPVAGAVGRPLGTAYNVVNKAANLRQQNPPRELTVHGRATGGRVGHQHLVDRLFSHVEKAKRVEKSRTSVLLNHPDEHIAKALNLAQEAI